MSEPLGLQDLLFGAMSGAAIVLAGALYALFFALGRLHSSRSMETLSLVAFAVLVAATWVLIQSLRLEGVWIAVTAVMLTGYFVAPRAIWHLCVGTHAGEDHEPSDQGATP